MGEAVPELPQGPGVALADGGPVPLDHASDLLEGEPLVVSEHEGLTEHLRERRDGIGHLPGGLPGLDVGGGPATAVREDGRGLLVVDALGAAVLLALAAPPVVADLVRRDRVDPRGEGPRGVVGRQRPVDVQEDLLGQVLREVLFPDEPPEISVDPLEVMIEEGCERVGVQLGEPVPDLAGSSGARAAAREGLEEGPEVGADTERSAWWRLSSTSRALSLCDQPSKAGARDPA